MATQRIGQSDAGAGRSRGRSGENVVSEPGETSAAAVGQRRLGKTGLSVSLLGFGASPLGDVFGLTDPGESNRAVHLAIERGINYFDVSPYYGLTLAEERLGKALAGRRGLVTLSSKCGRYGGDEFDFSAARITAGVEESLRRLGTDHLDILLAHDVEFAPEEQIVEETLPAMRRLVDQGKTRYVGISGYPLGMLGRVAEAVPIDCILTYCRYNLLTDDLNGRLLSVTERLGVGVINASPLCMGLLSDRAAPGWHPAPARVQEAARRAAEYCRGRGLSLARIALRYCLDHPGVASTLVGMATSAEVEENLSALEEPVPAEALAAIREILAPVRNYVWPSGLAENADGWDDGVSGEDAGEGKS